MSEKARRLVPDRNESAARAMRAGADENLKQMARESRISAVGMTTDEELFEQSAITLTAVRLVAPHLTAGNHTTVLASAQHKSKPEIE